MKKIIAATAIIAASALAAQAEMIELDAPMQAASLHEGGVDMVVYYVEEADHYQLVATYAAKTAPAEPSRIRMALQDGDRTLFSLPGQPQVAYGFERAGNTVTVSADVLGQQVAAR